ncbi:MAG: DNA replication/repair protein RecF [Caldilineaceae bacterium SB0661_bin_32]|uniref:DNA replication and repair protein RecF n=1 Tax=Caldilineaceae bacterium SB0661_bin_32 TaxID=2605255 RepID=A0A6B1D610_9CHLR|nr:DNA replication/repair protein RecF [Caldilineaceae bacterium SB0661_bin_32]
MFLSRLHLEHFRNYRELDLAFSAPVTLVQGRNGQGKTNLLEAVYYLATSKSRQVRTEREAVDRAAAEEPIPYARIRGEVVRREESTTLEILFTLRGDGINYTKQVRVNGAARRSMDLIGHLRAVLFLPEDLTLIAGSPSERRRYIDVALCQIDRGYCQTLSRYQKVVTQRNSLLKQLQERGQADSQSAAAQLSFWDDQLVELGTRVLARRHSYLAELAPIARRVHAELSQQQESLELLYLPSFNTGLYSEHDYQRLREGEEVETGGISGLEIGAETIGQRFRGRLETRRGVELKAGSSLYGPHRDELVFLVNGWNLRTYGSRGQQRTGALALKLAELQAMAEATGEKPVLLLDDVMSELDAQRRAALLEALADVRQGIVTTTNWGQFSRDFQQNAQLLQIEAGAAITAAGSL